MPHGHRLPGIHALTARTDLGFAPIASGVIARRKRVMSALERTHADALALRRMRASGDRLGSGPVGLGIPGRRIVVAIFAVTPTLTAVP